MVLSNKEKKVYNWPEIRINYQFENTRYLAPAYFTLFIFLMVIE